MGTTKDPEGFRRHTAGRGSVLGVKGGGAKRRGCGLGLGIVLVGIGLGAAALSLRAARVGGEPKVVAPTVGPGASDATETALADIDALTGEDGSASPALALGSTRAGVRADSNPATSQSAADLAGPRWSSHIRLLRGWTDEPLAHADVFWLGAADLRRHDEKGLVDIYGDPESVLQRLGRHGTSDADGRLRVDDEGGHLLVLGEGWMRALEIRPGHDMRKDVRVFPQRALTVDVVDWSGAPVPGWEVHLWRVDAQGLPRFRLKSLLTSSATGSVRYEDVDSGLRAGMERDPRSEYGRHAQQLYPDMPALERTRLRAALDPELAPAAWAEIDLAMEVLPHVRLQLPPLGRLHVAVADSQGRNVDWLGEIELIQAGAERSRSLARGRATFEHLRFGDALRVHAVRSDGARGAEIAVEPLSEDEPEREVVLPDVAPQPRIALRPLHPGGTALPRTWVEVWIHSRRALTEAERRDVEQEAAYERSLHEGFVLRAGSKIVPERIEELLIEVSHRRALRTDAGGYLELPLPAEFLERRQLTLSVSLVVDGKVLRSLPRSMERGELWTDLDFGNVPLLEPAPQEPPVK